MCIIDLKRVFFAVCTIMPCLSLWIHSMHHAYSGTFFCLLRLLLSCLRSTGDGKDELALLDENVDLETGEES